MVEDEKGEDDSFILKLLWYQVIILVVYILPTDVEIYETAQMDGLQDLH